MKQPNVLTKAAALTSFIVLLSGYVLYSAGVFDGWLGKEKNEIAGTTRLDADGKMIADSPEVDTMKKQVEREMMHSTKSAPMFEIKVDDAETKPEKKDRDFMGSSKSDVIFTPNVNDNPEEKPDHDSLEKLRDTERHFMGGSKSGTIFEVEVEKSEAEKKKEKEEMNKIKKNLLNNAPANANPADQQKKSTKPRFNSSKSGKMFHW
ncbi:MAG: hypothetical protein AAF570_15465 [Bacteroidota bacterium]